jgi:hypothetical protein
MKSLPVQSSNHVSRFKVKHFNLKFLSCEQFSECTERVGTILLIILAQAEKSCMSIPLLSFFYLWFFAVLLS